MSVSEKKYLVVGANSFMGRHLIASLKAENKVTGVYHRNTDKLFSDIENWKIDDLKDLADDFDVVFLVSAFIPSSQVDNDTRRKMFAVNVELVSSICAKYTNSRIVYCSTCSVYAPKTGVITEFDPEAGLNEYGVSKLWGEKIVQQASSHAIIRISSLYGEGMKQHTIIPNYIRRALTGKKIEVFGKGERMQNYIHVDDAINFLIAASNYKGNSIFLAVSAKSISNKELAGIIAEKTKSQIVFEGKDDSPSFFYNNELTIRELGYKCKVLLEEGLNDLIR